MNEVKLSKPADMFPWGVLFIRCADGKDIIRLLSGADSILRTVESYAAEYPGCKMRVFEGAGNEKNQYFKRCVENFWGVC